MRVRESVKKRVGNATRLLAEKETIHETARKNTNGT